MHWLCDAADTREDMNLFDDFTFGDEPMVSSISEDSLAVPTDYETTAMARSESNSSFANTVGTVSPQELFLRDITFSAPNSTAFTNLTSPSVYNTSPAFDDLDASPLFQDEILDVTGEADQWYSLFPDAAPQTAPSNAVASESQGSPLEPKEEYEVGAKLKQSRRQSASPKGSSPSATGIARKRNSPLPPIVVNDPNDTVAIKRARNTLAARKSRQKKMEKFDELEVEIEDLKKQVDYWKQLAIAHGAPQ